MKKIPMRTCIGCKEIKPKKELVRIVKDPEGNVSVDFTGRKNGRGAYICLNEECLDKAIKSRRLSREFSMQIENSLYDELRNQIKEGNADE